MPGYDSILDGKKCKLSVLQTGMNCLLSRNFPRDVCMHPLTLLLRAGLNFYSCFIFLIGIETETFIYLERKTLQRATWYFLVRDKEDVSWFGQCESLILPPGQRALTKNLVCVTKRLGEYLSRKSSPLTWSNKEQFSPATGVSDWHAKRCENEPFFLFFNCISNESPPVSVLLLSPFTRQCTVRSDSLFVWLWNGKE